MRENTVKKALKNGQVVIGTMVSECRGSGVMTMLASAGFDYVIIDMEHGTFNLETVEDMIAASKATNTISIVRTRGFDRLAVQGPLDGGADGLLVPQMEGVENVQQLISWMKYFPEGDRGMALRRAHSNFAKVNTGEYIKHANEQSMVVIQIETVKAIEEIEAMVSVPGVDAAFIGPNDLSQSYGVPGSSDDPRILEGLHKFIAACKKHGVAPGYHAMDIAKAKYWIDQGMQMIGISNDINMVVDTGAKLSGELRDYLKK